MKHSFQLLLLIFISQFGFAQRPGYFQQDVKYVMDVTFNPTSRMISGTLDFTYKNNSSETLTEIWFHLYPNAYKNNETPLGKQLTSINRVRFLEAPDSLRGWMNADFFQNESKLTQRFKSETEIDEVKVDLVQPIKPGETTILKIPFEMQIPGDFSRLGFRDKYFALTQWYPKVVVYDEDGWHPDSYLDFGEFYGEYGSFDVTIHLPKNYILDATGWLIDSPKEVQFMDSLINVTTTYYESTDPAFKKQFKEDFIAHRNNMLTNELKTVRFYAENVVDFAWFTSPYYAVRKGTNQDGVVSFSLITVPNLDGWRNAHEMALHAVNTYGEWVGKYPYPKASVVDGPLRSGGGMEYPMITVISSGDLPGTTLLDQVIIHEVGHNWFQAILGSNERQHAWMDEGINSYYELRVLEEKYGTEKSLVYDPKKLPLSFIHHVLDPVSFRELYQIILRRDFLRDSDLPNNLPADQYLVSGTGPLIIYQKGGFTMSSLEAYLGKETFDQAMKTYFDRWKFKHPKPKDLYDIFDEVSGKNVTPIFKDWIETRKTVDFAIGSVNTEKTSVGYRSTIEIKNHGDLLMGAPVSILTEKGDTITAYWYPENGNTITIESNDFPKNVGVNIENKILETNYYNNYHSSVIKLAFGKINPKLNYYQLSFFPVIGYEAYRDKWQLGVGFFAGEFLNFQPFYFATFYYAPNSQALGYRIEYRNRIGRQWSGYADVDISLFDQEGFSKQEIAYRWNYSKNKKTIFAEIGAGTYYTYHLDYVDKNAWQSGTYTTVDLNFYGMFYHSPTWKSEGSLTVSQGVTIRENDADFTKWTFTGNTAWESVIKYRFFMGVGYQNLPLQESIFAGGDIDPRRREIFVNRKGSYSMLNSMSNGEGMNMSGYGVSKDAALFRGKAGFSHQLYITVPILNSIFISAGNVFPTINQLDFSDLKYDAGIYYGNDMAFVSLPLWISHPVSGETPWDFRWTAGLNIAKLLERL